MSKFDEQTFEGYLIVNRNRLKEKLSNVELHCYTCVVMALKDCERGDYSVESMKSAFARLKQDADKIRSHDHDFYEMIKGFS